MLDSEFPVRELTEQEIADLVKAVENRKPPSILTQAIEVFVLAHGFKELIGQEIIVKLAINKDGKASFVDVDEDVRENWEKCPDCVIEAENNYGRKRLCDLHYREYQE